MLPTQRGELIVLNGHNITFQIMDHGEPRLVQREAKRAVLWGDIASVEHFVALPEPDGKNWADHGALASHTYPSGERVELGSDVFRRWQGTKLVSSITTGHPLEKFFFLNGEPIGLAGSGRALLFDPSTGTSTELRLSGIVNNGEHEWPQIFWHHNDPDGYSVISNILYRISVDARSKTLHFEPVEVEIPVTTVVTDVLRAHEQDILFIGTANKGLFIFRRERLEILNCGERALPVSVMATAETREGFLVAGVDHHVYHQTKTGCNEVESLLGTDFYHLPKDHEGMLWIWRNHEMDRYDPRTGQLTSIVKDLRMRPSIKAFGDSVLITLNGRIHSWKDGRIRPLEPPQDLAPILLYAESNGTVYGTTTKGVFRLHQGIRDYSWFKGLEKTNLRVVTRIEDLLLVGTYGQGAYIVDGTHAFRIPDDPSKALEHVHSFRQDGDRIWISTNRGLLRTTLSDLRTYLADQRQRPYLARYGTAAGASNLELNGGCTPPYLELTSGPVIYPSIEGVVQLDPATIPDPFPQSPLMTKALRVNNAPWPTERPLVLPYDVHSIEVNFTLPYWGDAENAQLEYTIPGIMNDWSALAPGERMVEVIRPPTGTHRILLRKVGSKARGLEAEEVVRFEVERPVWVQWPAVLGYFIALALLYWAVARWRTTRLQRQNAWLAANVAMQTEALTRANEDLRSAVAHQEKLISVIAHDVVPPLRFVARVAHSAEEMNRTGTERSALAETLEDLSSSSDKLFQNANNLLTWIRTRQRERPLEPRSLALYSFVEDCLDRVREMTAVRGTRLINKVDPEMSIRTDGDLLSIALNNALVNAHLHASASYIEVSARNIGGGCRIVVRDDGIGIPPDVIPLVNAELSGVSHHDDKARSGAAVGLGFVIIAECLRTLGGSAIIELAAPGTRLVIDLHTPHARPQGQNG